MELYNSLTQDKIHHLAPRPVIALGPECKVSEAIALMKQERTSYVLVLDRGKLVGIFTERDVLKGILQGTAFTSASVRDKMTANPVTVETDEPIAAAVEKMTTGGYRHLVVVKDGRPIGVINVKSLIHYMAEYFPEAVYNLPPKHDAAFKAPEGA
ncbi:MAG: CBS domain-containing protein [bacterium]